MSVARWIFQFRSAGERPLTADERVQLARSLRPIRIRRIAFAVASVILVLQSLGCLALAAENQPLFWAGVVGCLVLGGWLLSLASDAERLALLCRRALRLGTVERFERVAGDTTVRTLWNATYEDDDGHVDLRPMGEYWREEERFEEALARAAGRNPDWFESVNLDGVVLWVQGKPTKALLEPFVWETSGPSQIEVPERSDRLHDAVDHQT